MANESAAPGSEWLRACDSCDDFFAHGNDLPVAVAWRPGLPRRPADSYYLSQKPKFWPEDAEWPSIGWPRARLSSSIPPLERWRAGAEPTVPRGGPFGP